MKTMSNVFAIVFAIMAAASFYAAAFKGAHWHFATFFMCGFLSLLFFADSNRPDNTSLQ